MTIVDIWGGEASQDHLARYILSLDDAMKLARSELQGGFLVNLRVETSWGSYQNFDSRVVEEDQSGY